MAVVRRTNLLVLVLAILLICAHACARFSTSDYKAKEEIGEAASGLPRKHETQSLAKMNDRVMEEDVFPADYSSDSTPGSSTSNPGQTPGSN